MAIFTANLNFPADEVKVRFDHIKANRTSIEFFANSIQSELLIRDTVSDEEEKKRLDLCDLRLGERITDLIRSKFPSDSVLSEAENIPGKNDFQWVLDPVDGSMNFLRGLPLYAISIGLKYRGSAVMGFIILPGLDSVYTAISGSGAFKNGTHIQVSEISSIQRAFLVFSFPSRNSNLRDFITELTAFVSSARSIRRTGSLIVDLCFLCEGKLDGIWERKVEQFDLTAASVILQEAGADISDFKDQEILSYPSDVLISNGKIHGQILDVLNKTFANMN